MASASSPVTPATDSASNGRDERRAARRRCGRGGPGPSSSQPADAVDLGEQRGEEVEVGVGPDWQVVAEAELDRPDPAGVHERDAAATLPDAADGVDGVGHRHRGEVAAARVAAEAQEVVGVVEVRRREHGLGAEHGVHRRELVGEVLRSARRTAGSTASSPRTPYTVAMPRGGVGERVPPVATDGLGAVLAPGSPAGARRSRRSRRPRSPARTRPVGSVFGLARRSGWSRRLGSWCTSRERRALVAGEPARHGVVAVGVEGDAPWPRRRRSRRPAGTAARRCGRTSTPASCGHGPSSGRPPDPPRSCRAFRSSVTRNDVLTAGRRGRQLGRNCLHRFRRSTRRRRRRGDPR